MQSKSLLKEIEKLQADVLTLEGTPQTRSNLQNYIQDYCERFIQSLPSRDGFIASHNQAENFYNYPITDDGYPLDEIIRVFEQSVDQPGLNAASGRHLGYVPGGGVPTAAAGDYLAAITNKYSGIFFAGPGAVRIENQMIQLCAKAIGYTGNYGGNLASGGSIANLIAITAGRDAHGIMGRNYHKTVIYGSKHMHHCIDKSIRITGLKECVYRNIELDGNYKIDTNKLADQIEQDVKNGLSPFLVIASAGTTNCGVIDPLDRIADICDKHELWFHVDGAYGGLFCLLEEEKFKFKGIERADSVVIDPHKSLFLPYGLGIAIVKNVNHLLKSQFYEADYMQDAIENRNELSPAELSPELTKHFRGLRMWLPLQIHGLKPFKSALREKILLTKYFREALVAIPNIRIVNEPELTIFAYRYENNSFSKQRNNQINKKLTEEIHKEGKVFLSSTNIDDEICLRIAILSFRTHIYEIELALNEIKTKLESIIKMH
ncbi:MAG: aminotransferase class I/II-fold pyridoxal phosphate-dependent enzyme [Crocinitomicaceae bacterium]|nr:aminotransferase class I/II-fold pyridoxal phosphate-dependent enzyme [Crocinitomicaceae bacterium]